MKQQDPFYSSLSNTITICQQVEDERLNHIHAIESSRNKKIFDKDNKYIDTVISTIGKNDYDHFIHSMKKDILGNENVKDFECNQSAKTPKFRLLQTQYEQWKELTDWSQYDHSTPMTCTSVQHRYHMAKHARKQIKANLFTLLQIRQEEWTNSKTHLIRIGKYDPIARMTNPQENFIQQNQENLFVELLMI